MSDFSYEPYGPSGVSLRDVKLGLYGCTVPIGTTGFGLTRVEGEVTLGTTSTKISLGVSVESTRLKVAGQAALRGDLDMSMVTNPAEFGLSGSLYVFAFHAGQLDASIKESDGFRATLWLEAIVARGEFHVHAWSSSGDFHLTGSAMIDIGIPKGQIWSGCVPYPCCSTNCHWVHKWWGGYPSCEVSCSWCHTCVTVPPHDWELGSVNAEFGEFVASHGTIYGFKGWVKLMGYDAGFFVDNKGDLVVGNVDKYHLLDSNQVAAARSLQQRLLTNRLITPDLPWTSGPLTFLPNGDLYVTIPISQTADVAFAMSRNTKTPEFSLIDPQGNHITPDSLPANVIYSRTVTSTLGVPAEMAQLAAARLVGAVKLYQTIPELAAPTGIVTQTLETCQIQPLSLIGSSQARLRLIHAAPGLPAVDLLAESSLLTGPVSATQISDYQALDSGIHTIELTQVGTTQPALISATLQLEVGKEYSLLLVEEGGKAKMLLLPDDNELPNPGKTRLRYVNASPLTGELDLLIHQSLALFNKQAYQAPSGYKEIQAGVYDLEVRSSNTMTSILDLPGITLVEGTVNTLVVYDDPNGEAAVRAFPSVDTRRPARLHFVNASQDEPLVDVSIQGTTIFSSVVFSDTTPYLPLESGSQDVLLSETGSGNVLAVASLDLLPNRDSTLVLYGAAGARKTLHLADDNTIPEFGKARVRFVHLSPNFPSGGGSLSIVKRDGPTWFTGVPFEGITDYITVDAGTYTLDVIQTGVLTPTLIFTDAVFTEGSVVTLIAMTEMIEEAPVLQLSMHSDAISHRNEQLVYSVDQAEAGIWTVKLSGESSAKSSYLLSVLGANPPPALSEVTVSQSDADNGIAGWRLKSDELTTRVDIYVTTGPVTRTHVITGSNQLPITVTQPLYIGTALAEGIHGPVDGTPYTHTLDLSHLESGTYWVWLEAEDGRNPPVRTYAPEPLEINHAPGEQNQSSSPLDVWDADIMIASGYRRLLPSWDPYPNPDIDGYVLYLGDSPGAATPLRASEVITVENHTSASILSLDPGKMYYIAIQAMDKNTGWSILSSEVSATTETAEFELSGPSRVEITGGQSWEIQLKLTTELAPYPETVMLSLGCGHQAYRFGVYLPMLFEGKPKTAGGAIVTPAASSQTNVSCDILDGIHAVLPQPVAVPLVSGELISLTLSATHSLPEGSYVLPVVASGGGVTRKLEIELVVHEPRFALEAEPGTVSLWHGESVDVKISASRVHGEEDPIHLELYGAPAGLSWSFSNPIIHTGESVTLTLTDTHIANHGSYALTIIGEDGENHETAVLALNLDKPEFAIQAKQTRLGVQAGSVAAFALDLTAFNGWTQPVTLTVSQEGLPALASAGFIAAPAVDAFDSLTGSAAEISLVPPTRVFLIVATSPHTPSGVYHLLVEGQALQLNETLTLTLVVDDDGLVVLPKKWFAYLPIMTVDERSSESLTVPSIGVAHLEGR
jgi:hypothetical protein